MKFLNLTNRTINILDEHGNERFSIKPSGMVVAAGMEAVVKERLSVDGTDHMVEVVGYEYGHVTTMPEPVPGVYYIVSYAVLQALKGTRSDVVSPDTSPGSVVRPDGSQKVIGVRQLRRI